MKLAAEPTTAYLHGCEGVVLQEGQADDRHQQELHAERVVLRVVAVPKAHVDQVHGGVGQSQEHHLGTGSEVMCMCNLHLSVCVCV